MKILALLIALISAPLANAEVKMDETNTLVFNGYINNESMNSTFNLLKDKGKKLKAKEPLMLIINSSGGELDAATDFIKKCKTLGRPVNTVTMMAAGAAFYLVQGLDKRYAVNESLFIILPARTGGFMEGLGDLVFKSKLEQVLKKVKEVNKVSAKRMDMSVELYEELSKDEFYANTKDAARLGMYDELIYFTNGVMLHNFILGRQYER